MPRLYPQKKYLRIVSGVLSYNMLYSEVALKERVSKSTVCRTLRRAAGGVLKPKGNKGLLYRGRKLNQVFLALVRVLYTSPCTETLYLDEAAALLQPFCSFGVTLNDVSRACRTLRLTHKKLTTRFREANTAQQDAYRAALSRFFTRDQLVWLDESAVCSKNCQRLHGHAPRGQRTLGTTLRFKGLRYSVLPIVTARGVLDWYMVQGSVNIVRFKDFVQRLLVKHVQPFPKPRSVVVMDNCRVHRNPDVVEMIEATGAQAEMVFAKMKGYLVRNYHLGSQVDAFIAINCAMSSITPEDCQGFVRKCHVGVSI